MNMTIATTQRRVTEKTPSTVEEILCASRGNGAFISMMKWAVGLAICTDGIEVTLLSYLVPCVAAEWDLSSIQQGSLTASVFAGELVGALVLGVISDIFGRRPSFQIAAGLVAVFGLFTVVAPSFWWLLCFRSMVGVGAGGMEVPFDLLGEIVPRKEKARILVDVQATWALGSLFVGIVAWAVLSFGHSWRLLALFSAIPPCAVLCCFLFIQESPRWLLANGREREAKEVLQQMAKRNGVVLGDVSISLEEKSKGKGGGLLDLWRVAELRKRTFVSCAVWAAFGFLYYGIILLSSKVMGDDGTCSFDYSVLFFAASSELVANLFTRVYVGKLDRSASMTINFVVSGLITGLMPLNGAFGWLLFTSFVARGTAYTAACFAWVITPELYPTEARSTGHACSNALARCGAIGASYWVSYSASNEILALLLLVVGVLGGLAGQALPRDRQLEANGRGQDAEDEAESRPLLWSGRDREAAHTFG